MKLINISFFFIYPLINLFCHLSLLLFQFFQSLILLINITIFSFSHLLFIHIFIPSLFVRSNQYSTCMNKKKKSMQNLYKCQFFFFFCFFFQIYYLNYPISKHISLSIFLFLFPSPSPPFPSPFFLPLPLSLYLSPSSPLFSSTSLFSFPQYPSSLSHPPPFPSHPPPFPSHPPPPSLLSQYLVLPIMPLVPGWIPKSSVTPATKGKTARLFLLAVILLLLTLLLSQPLIICYLVRVML